MSNIFKENIRVKTEELKRPITKKGKHYAISDIHGMYDAYMEAVGKLSKEDELFIIGDVIDRGEDGIKILLDIIERPKNPGNGPKIIFLLGNHEVMLLSTLEIMLNRSWNGNELNILMESDNFVDFFNSIKNNGITIEEAYFMNNWIKENHGDKTIFSFYRNLNSSQMKEIYKFLLKSYVVLPQKIGEEHYLFVHSMPINDKTKLEEMKIAGKGYNIMELTPEEYRFMLTERDKQTYNLAQQVGFTTICGHTPKCGQIINSKENSFVRIDAGCGHKKKTSKLALYCIDDDKVEYIDEIKENDLDEER